MNIEELEEEINRVNTAIRKTKSRYAKNDLTKYLRKLYREKKDYYRFRSEARA